MSCESLFATIATFALKTLSALNALDALLALLAMIATFALKTLSAPECPVRRDRRNLVLVLVHVHASFRVYMMHATNKAKIQMIHVYAERH